MEQQIQPINWKRLTREERGQLISKSFKIVRTAKGWRVPSQSYGGRAYLVTFDKHEPKCNCPDCEIKRTKCKHIYAVEFYIQKKIDEEGKITETKGIRVTYSQKWRAYDNAQTNEKLFFLTLLKDLCQLAEQPAYKFGRPKIPTSDLLFSSILKVYSTFSLRRFMSDAKIAQEKGLVDYVPCFSSVAHFLQREDVTDILKELIKISSTPLSSVEKDFAVDSSGFSTSRFARYFDFKWGKEREQKIWLKAHVICGVKTNIVAGIEVTTGHSADSPQLNSLVEQAAKNFKVSEVSCDRAYSSRKNLQLIEDVGAAPYIPFKKLSKARRGATTIWGKMFHYFMYKHEEFLEHYHKRSNVETVFHMIKTKFKDNLRSKTTTAQVNELLCKIICHNICVVIQEMNELKISGQFIIENAEQ